MAVRLSYPDWIVEELVAQYGPTDTSSLEVGNEPPPVALRDTERATVEAVADELRAGGVEVSRGTLVDGGAPRGIGDPARLAAVAEGRATPQDEASQAVVRILDPQPGETVVDVAATPGASRPLSPASGAPRTGRRLRSASRAHPPGHFGADRLGLGRVLPVVADGRSLPLRRSR